MIDAKHTIISSTMQRAGADRFDLVCGAPPIDIRRRLRLCASRKRHAHTPTQSIYVLGDVSPCAHTMLILGIGAYWGEWIDANARMMVVIDYPLGRVGFDS